MHTICQRSNCRNQNTNYTPPEDSSLQTEILVEKICLLSGAFSGLFWHKTTTKNLPSELVVISILDTFSDPNGFYIYRNAEIFLLYYTGYFQK